MKIYCFRFNIVMLAFLVLCVAAGSLFADKVVLKQGQILTGDIISDKPQQLILDIGIDVLVIPKDKILEFEYTKSYSVQAEPNEPNAIAIGPKQTDGLYSTSASQKTSIEKAVEAVAEAVVKVQTPAGLGSGFFINEDGYLITNYHVIERETKIEVTVFRKTKDGFERKQFKKVKIDAINPFIDLALLKVEDLADTIIKSVPLGDIEKVEVGEAVFAVGNPMGLERTVTNGVISTKNRALEGLVYIQTNADINPGNSGGPLFNLAGEAIGVTNMGYVFLGGLGFAIPVDYVKQFIDNREAFAYDKDNPNSGFRYLQPDKRQNRKKPDFLRESN
jgi:serine protease Do